MGTPTSEEVSQLRAKGNGLTLLSLEDAQKEMSDKLLAGWSMLDLVCPISGYPLVKNKKTGVVWSIRCQLEVKNEENEVKRAVKTIQPEQFQDSEEDIQAKRIAEKLMEGWTLSGEMCPVTHSCPLLVHKVTKKKWSPALAKFISADGHIEEDEPEKVVSNKPVPEVAPSRHLLSRDKVSSLIGEKLLQGWIMLDEECPVTHSCPLMQDPSNNKRWSAALNGYIELDESKPPSKSSTEVASDLDMQSKRIGEKLMSGWKMLEEDCPITKSCPLMMEPQTGRKYSPALDRFIDESQRKSQVERPKNTGVVVKQEEKLHVGSWVDDCKDALDDDLEGLVKPTVKRVDEYLETSSVRTMNSGVSLNGGTSSEELLKSEAALVSKLKQCRRAVATIEIDIRTSEEQFDQCDRLVRLIASCANSIERIHSACKSL